MENQLSKRAISQIAKIIKLRLKGRSFKKIKIDDFHLNNHYLLFSLQIMAHEICCHYGLGDYNPVITIEKLNGAGGRINLNKDKDIFIDIDSSRKYDKWQYIAIIAHEVAHKYLYVHDVYYEGQKNEFITDAAAVYAGFGDIMRVAAYKETKSEWDTDFRHDADGRLRATKHVSSKTIETLGYLLPWQIVFLQNCLKDRYFEIRIRSKYFYIMKPWAFIPYLCWLSNHSRTGARR